MPRSRGFYSILGAQDLQDLTNQLNTLLSEVSDRLDKIEGLRGTATIESDLELSGSANIATNANITGDVAVSGAQTVSGVSTVGSSRVTGSIQVSGAANFDAQTLIAGHFRVLRVDDNPDLVTETVTFEGGMSNTGNADIGGNLTVGTDTFLAGEVDGPNVFKMTPGIIAIWYGSIATIPNGWALCDGSTVNGLTTPDLVDSFIVGAGDTGAGDQFDPGSTGGTGNTTLTTETADIGPTTSPAAGATPGYVTGFTNNPHDHDLIVTQADKYNLTPYYALAYIMYVGVS